MYDFVEQPVTIRNSEFPMLRKEPSHVFMQYGLQPTFFLWSDVEAEERPQPIFKAYFKRRKRKA